MDLSFSRFLLRPIFPAYTLARIISSYLMHCFMLRRSVFFSSLILFNKLKQIYSFILGTLRDVKPTALIEMRMRFVSEARRCIRRHERCCDFSESTANCSALRGVSSGLCYLELFSSFYFNVGARFACMDAQATEVRTSCI